MGFIEQLGLQAAGTAIGGGMGMMLGKWNDERQRQQQEHLQGLQIRGQKEMMDYGYQKQLQMWKDTGYKAQVEQMNEAGINPGLLYGMSGGGGQTTGSASGNVSGGTAQQNPGEIQASMGMGLQLAQMAAQTELLKSQAKKTDIEANKIGGVDTKESEARTENIWQNTDNLRQSHQLQKLEITMKNIENFEKQSSQDDRLDYIEYQTKLAERQMKMAGNDLKISDATINDNIKKIKTEAIGAVLKNILTQSQTNKTISDIRVNDQQIRQSVNNIMINWDKLSNENKIVEIQKALMQWTTDPNREAINQALGTLNNLMHAMKKGTTINYIQD